MNQFVISKKEKDQVSTYEVRWKKTMADKNEPFIKGLNEKEIFTGKGIKALDDVSNKLLKEFNKGKISL